MKVLAIEHNCSDVERILKALSGSAPSSFRLELASGLSEALTRLRDGRFDVVLLDLDLPDSRGLDIFRVVCCVAPRIPIVVLVSRENEATGRTAIEEGARDCLVKEALSEHSLSRALSLAIEPHRARDSLDDSIRFAGAALDGLSDHIAIIDEGGFIVMVNRAWREFEIGRAHV